MSFKSGDGGLYAELLQNRAFQQVSPSNQTAALNAWSAVNGAELKVIADSEPVSDALPNSLQVNIPSRAKGPVGFSNSGIKVDQAWTYKASLYLKFPAKSSFSGKLTLALRTVGGNAVLAEASTTIKSTQTTWKQIQLDLKPTKSSADTNNIFTVTLDGHAASGQTLNFALMSLFPPTYKNRPNGMRIDIAETLAELNPGIFRFPGGNNLFIEDIGAEPIMGVWDGYALGGYTVAEGDLKPYIQQAIDQINFVVGDPRKSAPAALRASLGRPQPFRLNYVEIGNEDFYNSSDTFRDFVGNLSAAFPNLTFLATTFVGNPILTPKPQAYDVHDYNTPRWFANNSFRFDAFPRDGTIYFEGEYAAISTNTTNLYGTPATGRFAFPAMSGTTGEAAYMTGLERNSDIVFASSYAPLLNHINSTHWTPDLIAFDAARVIKSTSYHAQKLFSLNKGDQYLPSTIPIQNGTLYWSVVVNTVETPASLAFQLPFKNVASFGTLQILQGGQNASNTPAQPDAVEPVTTTIATGKTINYTAPGISVSVLKVNAH
ncbi:arabinofuranosidase [Irpex rosettiformis]|uniref:Arabinofuranosidase n=1 Tax=Irpex rosettiformis TaxID=378272 RepID=A0ACB8U379_9APHY|nr:arabinofuranosidase [Irpex rosettiformis]